MSYDTNKYELEMLKQEDSVGIHRDGAISGTRTPYKSVPIAHPEIIYKDKWMQADLYCDPLETNNKLLLVMYCPKCMNMLSIPEERKKMEWDAQNGKLSVEPFTCAWELDNDAPVGMYKFGTNVCRWTAGIQKGRAYDAPYRR